MRSVSGDPILLHVKPQLMCSNLKPYLDHEHVTVNSIGVGETLHLVCWFPSMIYSAQRFWVIIALTSYIAMGPSRHHCTRCLLTLFNLWYGLIAILLRVYLSSLLEKPGWGSGLVANDPTVLQIVPGYMAPVGRVWPDITWHHFWYSRIYSLFKADGCFNGRCLCDLWYLR